MGGPFFYFPVPPLHLAGSTCSSNLRLRRGGPRKGSGDLPLRSVFTFEARGSVSLPLLRGDMFVGKTKGER